MENEMQRFVRVGLIQTRCTSDVQENFDHTVLQIQAAAAGGAQIICTQELFKSHYFCQAENPDHFSLAEEVRETSPTVMRLSKLAAELQVVLVASLFEKRALGLYHNTAVVLDADGSYLGKYRKMHIPDDPHYYEKYYFTPGDLGYRSFVTRYATIGVMICWDQWFPEAARLTAMSGAEIILIPTAIGHTATSEESGYDQAWEIVQRGHAVANACYVAAVNRTGFEPEPGSSHGIKFWGSSFVADPYGKVLSRAAKDDEEIIVCELDLSYLKRVREGYSFPFRDRRVDSYQQLTSLYTDT
jgi:N-carbamoylputrescine amidase